MLILIYAAFSFFISTSYASQCGGFLKTCTLISYNNTADTLHADCTKIDGRPFEDTSLVIKSCNSILTNCTFSDDSKQIQCTNTTDSKPVDMNTVASNMNGKLTCCRKSNVPPPSSSCGGFLRTCTALSYTNDGKLQANCVKKDGTRKRSEIVVKACSTSIANCELKINSKKITCTDANSNPIDMSKVAMNDDGEIKCCKNTAPTPTPAPAPAPAPVSGPTPAPAPFSNPLIPLPKH